MPTYTYLCPECGCRFDLFHSMSDSSEKHCPECDTIASRQISGGAGLIFKGSGFYITDYKNGHDPAGGLSNKNGAGKKEEETAKNSEETKSKKASTKEKVSAAS